MALRTSPLRMVLSGMGAKREQMAFGFSPNVDGAHEAKRVAHGRRGEP